MLGMVFCWMDRSKISVRTPMDTGPSCFRCLYKTPSGLTEEVGFVCSIACFVMLVVKGGDGLFCGPSSCCILSIFLHSV